jgi:hypothetical protein
LEALARDSVECVLHAVSRGDGENLVFRAVLRREWRQCPVRLRSGRESLAWSGGRSSGKQKAQSNSTKKLTSPVHVRFPLSLDQLMPAVVKLTQTI